MCTRSVRVPVAPSLRKSSSAYSRRSKDFMTAGSRCWPALVSTKECGRRSNNCTPTIFSSAITWRDNALCDISSALAAAVKLKCLATPSKARRAFNGSHRRSRCELVISRCPGFCIADCALLIGDDGSRCQIQMICGPKSGGCQYQQRRPQRSCVGRPWSREPVAQEADRPGSNDQIQNVGDQQRYGDKHVAHAARREIVEQAETRTDIKVNGG